MNSKDRFAFLINAGHGGVEPTTGQYFAPGKKTLHTNGKPYHHQGWFYEGVFNRQIAAEFIAKATNVGILCYPIHYPIADMPLKTITDTANGIARELALANIRTMFLSFHANAATNTTSPQNSAQGVCSFVFNANSRTGEIARSVTLQLQNLFDRHGSRRRASLVLQNPLHITKFTSMPAILFELGFFDNPHNADLLMMPEFRSEMVDIILQGLVRELGI
jgi:hypothetical protein